MLRKTILAAAVAVSSLSLPASAFAGYFGAIAFSQVTGESGWSRNYNSRQAAADAAYNNCNAADCRVILNVTNACAALATAPDGSYGTWWHVNKRQAERKALAACSNYSGGCRIVVSLCSQNR